MNYAEIKYNDIANGTGVRTCLFVSGCTHHCKGCFNACTWDFSYGMLFDKNTENAIIESLKPVHIAGLTILGGEPMEVDNQRGIANLIKRVKAELPEKNIWIYSGYTYDEITDTGNKRCHCEVTDYIMDSINILVDGEFKEDLKDITLKFRGSSNQRIIDVPESRKKGTIVLSSLNN